MMICQIVGIGVSNVRFDVTDASGWPRLSPLGYRWRNVGCFFAVLGVVFLFVGAIVAELP
jgi:hypothetical protein